MYSKDVGATVKVVYQDGNKISIIQRGKLLEYDSSISTLKILDFFINKKVYINVSQIHKLIILEEDNHG